MNNSTKQLRMPFGEKNVLRDNLREGTFTLALEYAIPEVTQPFKLAMLPGLDLARYAEKDERITSLVLADNGNRERHPLHRVADALRAACSKQTSVLVGGAGRDEKKWRELLATLVSSEISTVLVQSGYALPDHPRDKRGLPGTDPARYISSIRMVQLLKKEYPGLLCGAEINPFKYEIHDVYLQNNRLLRSLSAGADFICTAPGWDMVKFQELAWFLRTREIDDPVIARLRVLRPDQVSAVLDHEFPGITLSREFAALLQREAMVDDAPALLAQLRRIALQTVGCRLFGYSGVLISGLENANAAALAMEQIEKATKEFPDYASWWEVWTDFHRHVEVAPYPQRYYLFRELFQRDRAFCPPEEMTHFPTRLEPPAFRDRLRASLGGWLGLKPNQGWFRRLMGRLICGATARWNLPRTFYLPASACPKGLEDGACEGTREDGLCEFGHQPCFYHRVLRLANYLNRLESLEKIDED